MRRILTIAVACAIIASAGLAKPPLREVSEIDDSLMMVAIADEIRKSCDGISARLVRAYAKLNTLKDLANEKGYSDDEIRAYVKSKTEQQRMRVKAETFLAGKGVDARSTPALCSFGKRQIQLQTEIGVLLR